MSDYRSETVIDNIRGWRSGGERLDVMALYDELARRYGPSSPTDYCAHLLNDLVDVAKGPADRPNPIPSTPPPGFAIPEKRPK